MLDFKAKIHQIRSRLGLRPHTPLGELTALPRGPSELFAVVYTLVHCNCFVPILFDAYSRYFCFGCWKK